MKEYRLSFDLAPFDQLDQFALLACQTYNLGNQTDWFGSFRGGFYGLKARVHGVTEHFFEVHAWRPKAFNPTEIEYHLSSVFFNMDSAIECFIFAINALGNAVDPTKFLDVTNDIKLKQVAPCNILGTGGKPPLTGYSQYFPSLQRHWQTNQGLLHIITEQHDVSKHRSTIFIGGQTRKDPPDGFFKSLGIANDSKMQVLLSPMEEIVLKPDPKSPRVKRTSVSRSDMDTLEKSRQRFFRFHRHKLPQSPKRCYKLYRAAALPILEIETLWN